MAMFPSKRVVICILWLLHMILCVETPDTNTPSIADVKRSGSVCFSTVTHYYSNPDVTGNSAIEYSYKHDDFKTKKLTLSCETGDNNLFIKVESVSLLLPTEDTEDQYCVESKNKNFDSCKESSQCDCCLIPQKTCESAENLDGYSARCNRERNCTISVTSKFLNKCMGRMYKCENKKCHSWWAKVTYRCQTKDVHHKKRFVLQCLDTQ